MKVAIRPLVDTDLEGIDRLRTIVFADRPEAFDTAWQASVWRWLGTHPLAGEMHRWVVATGEGEVVGHLAAIPQYYRIQGQRVVAHASAEYGVLPQYGRQAVLLMRNFFRVAENCVSCNTVPAVIGVQRRLGAEETGKLCFAAKVRDVSGLPGFPTPVPTPVPQLLNWGLRAADAALISSLFVQDQRVETLGGFDESFDELFENVATAMPCLAEKDAAFLRWRYGPGSPQERATILGVRGEGRLLGYAVIWASIDGDGYLLDLTAHPGRHDVSRSLLRESVRRFRQEKVRSIRYRFIESPTSPRTRDLWRVGLLPSNKKQSTMMVRFTDSSLHKAALDPTHWSYSLGDGEATFWIR